MKPPSSASARVAVVIPCINEEAYIEIVLEAVRAQSARPSEVILVDCGSADGTVALAHRYGARHPEPPLRILQIRERNTAAALNAGIAASDADIIVRIDAHSRPAPDYIERALRTLENTGAAVVGGIWRIMASGPDWKARGIAAAVAHPLGAGDAAYRLASSGRLGRPRRVDTVPFGCFRKSHWAEIGAYNEQLLANEDYEFNYRTRASGAAVVLDPHIRCEYFARATFGALARQYFRYGWWKGRMLSQYARSIRLRQVIPALFVPAWVLLGGMAAVMPAMRIPVAGLLGLYASILLASGLLLARGELRVALGAAAAFLTVHAAWSAGITSFLLDTVRPPVMSRPHLVPLRPPLARAAVAFAAIVGGALTIGAPLMFSGRLTNWMPPHPTEAATDDLARMVGELRRLDPRDILQDGVLIGEGTPPGGAAAPAWLARAVSTNEHLHGRAFVVTADPWGHAYFVKLSETGEGAVISAGPDGRLDTAFDRATKPQGDDIGVVLRYLQTTPARTETR